MGHFLVSFSVCVAAAAVRMARALRTRGAWQPRRSWAGWCAVLRASEINIVQHSRRYISAQGHQTTCALFMMLWRMWPAPRISSRIQP